MKILMIYNDAAALLSSLLLFAIFVSHVHCGEENYYTSSLRGLSDSSKSTEPDKKLPEKKLRIIGGVKSQFGRYPYYALMNGNSLCGAVLIAKQFVLTAAHCRDADVDFAIGPTTFNGGIKSVFVDSKIHRSYDENTYNNDIAIFRLKEEITDVPYVRISDEEIYDVGTAMTVIGFGDINPDERETDFADHLHEVDVEYVSSDVCGRDHRGEIFDDMMCAKATGKDACYGDSGGPLLMTPNDDHNDDRLVGIVSWGRGCADEDYPGVYTRISYFYDWIVETLCTMDRNGVPDYIDCNDVIEVVDIEPLTIEAPAIEHNIEFISSSSITDFPTEFPTPSPTTTNKGDDDDDDGKEPPIRQCGHRGSFCESADDCCSDRCNFSTQTCNPESSGNRDKISIGLGGSAGGSPDRRRKNGSRYGGGLAMQIP